MDNNQQNITADLTDKQLSLCYLNAFNRAYDKPGACVQDGQRAGYRAVAALAREGWRPVRSDAMPADEGEALKLSQQLHELAGILESLQIPHWPSRVLRAAELLVQPKKITALSAPFGNLFSSKRRWVSPSQRKSSECPWEVDGWLDETGKCWMGDPDSHDLLRSWHLCQPEEAPQMPWSAPYWAIFTLATDEAS